MRFSTVFELLLIFLLLAFAAWGRIIDKKNVSKIKYQQKQATSNRYCTCSNTKCNCCRDFSIPIVRVNGPGCASLQYLKNDRIAISMSFGNRIITNTTVSGRKPKPVCMELPGSISKFCGRLYSVGRTGDEFNACLSLELQSLNDIEAALRVSCFKFGSKGLRLEPAQPIPAVELNEADDDEDDDDDDDDEFDLVGDEDDDEEEDLEADDSDNDVDSADYTGLSVFGDDILGAFFDTTATGGSSGSVSKPITRKKVITTTTTTTTRKPIVVRRPSRRPAPQQLLTTRRPASKQPTPPTRVSTTKRRRTNRPTRRPTQTPTRRTSTTVTSTTVPTTTVAASSFDDVKLPETTTQIHQLVTSFVKPVLIPGLTNKPAPQPDSQNYFQVNVKPQQVYQKPDPIMPETSSMTMESQPVNIENKPVEEMEMNTETITPMETEQMENNKPMETDDMDKKPMEVGDLEEKPTETDNTEKSPVVDNSMHNKPMEVSEIDNTSMDEENIANKPTNVEMENKPIEMDSKPVEMENKPVEMEPVKIEDTNNIPYNDIKQNLIIIPQPEVTSQKLITFIPNLNNFDSTTETIPNEAIQILTSQLLMNPEDIKNFTINNPIIAQNEAMVAPNSVNMVVDQMAADEMTTTTSEQDSDKRVEQQIFVATDMPDTMTTELASDDDDMSEDNEQLIDMIERDNDEDDDDEEEEEEDDEVQDDDEEDEEADDSREVGSDTKKQDEENEASDEKVVQDSNEFKKLDPSELVEESRIFRFKWPWEY